ncbi:hypothetical protein [Helicobacter felis]|uniref:Uncharacterized protein n=1 Tax=Helicobacter felis (strain ATCC 49179 / CCUG 28539 / NCTC 12436 / CS1) TaxID=936155 RepID=E7AC61_HELFC|nr:hypothetical protein [Helicobacter felis]CBY82143.1 putative uncharacterized protein [Helicobacter felis ATCC 49179]
MRLPIITPLQIRPLDFLAELKLFSEECALLQEALASLNLPTTPTAQRKIAQVKPLKARNTLSFNQDLVTHSMQMHITTKQMQSILARHTRPSLEILKASFKNITHQAPLLIPTDTLEFFKQSVIAHEGDITLALLQKGSLKTRKIEAQSSPGFKIFEGLGGVLVGQLSISASVDYLTEKHQHAFERARLRLLANEKILTQGSASECFSTPLFISPSLKLRLEYISSGVLEEQKAILFWGGGPTDFTPPVDLELRFIPMLF